MAGLEELADDEIRARLGLAPVNRPATVAERIEAHYVRSMPEAFDPEEPRP